MKARPYSRITQGVLAELAQERAALVQDARAALLAAQRAVVAAATSADERETAGLLEVVADIGRALRAPKAPLLPPVVDEDRELFEGSGQPKGRSPFRQR